MRRVLLGAAAIGSLVAALVAVVIGATQAAPWFLVGALFLLMLL